MSGIVGVIGAGIPLNREVRAMAGLLKHRGSQHNHEWSKSLANGWGIALACLGESWVEGAPGSLQPVLHHEKVLLFDGQLHNRQQLKQTLAAADIPVEAMNEAELLLEAWHHWGAECLHHIQGCYAIALFDITQNTLYLARDPLGIKPLFYTFNGEQFNFCSELKPLTSIVKTSFNTQALLPFLVFGAEQGRATHLTEIHRVEPGQLLVLTREAKLERHEWRPVRALLTNDSIQTFAAEKLTSPVLLTQALSNLESQLKAVIGYYFEHQPKTQLLLTGGIGSGLLAALTQSLLGQAEAMVCIPTTHQGPIEGAIAERDAARQTARHLGVRLHEVEVKLAIGEDFAPLLAAAGEPLCSSEMILDGLLAKALTQMHGSAFLSGLGASTLFAGEDQYRYGYFVDRLRRLPQWLRYGLRQVWLPCLKQYDVQVADLLRQTLNGLALDAEQAWFASDALDNVAPWRLLLGHASFDATWQAFVHERTQHYWRFNSDTVNRWCYMNLLLSLSTKKLVSIERHSMARSKQVVFPFLDEGIVRLALKMPGVHKIETRWWAKPALGQLPLRQLAHAYLPDAIVMRPKQMLKLPLRQWLKVDLAHWVQDYLLSKKGLASRGYLSANTLRQWVEEHRSDRADHSEVLWRLLSLEFAFRQMEG